jgi:hypothetical protein
MTKMISAAAAIVGAGLAFASLPVFAQNQPPRPSMTQNLGTEPGPQGPAATSQLPAPPTQAATQATTATNAVLNNPAAAAEPLVLWQAAANGQIPPNAIPGGQEQGKPLAICAAPYKDGRHPGKVVGKTCNFGYGGAEIKSEKFDILLGNSALLAQNPLFVRWVPAQNGQVPPGAFLGAQEPGRVLPICRANYQGGVQPGKLVVRNCNVAFNGKEVLIAQYEVLVVSRLGTEIPTATLSAVAANPQLAAPAPAASNAAPGARGIINGVGGIGGVSPINVQGMDLESAMMMVQSNRASLLEAQLKDQIDSVAQRNTEIAKMNQKMSELRSERAKIPNENPPRPQAAQLDGQIQQIKSQIDAMSNSQQMDMLRLQSMTNKRNEAFETMTNFIKKMQDSRSSIVGNMR